MNTSQVKESLLENLPLPKVTWRGHCSYSKRRARGLVISGLEAEWRTGLLLRMIFLLSLEEEQGDKEFFSRLLSTKRQPELFSFS